MADNQDNTPDESGISLNAPDTTDDVKYLKGKGDFVSAGERIHKWSTYLGIDWLFNAFSGVSFAYLTKYTEKGQKYWSGPITKFFENMLGKFIKDPAQVKKNAAYGNIFMSVIAGGMFTLPPLLVLESKNVKKAIIKFLDKRIYGKEKVENDPKFQKSYDDMDNEPKKDFWTGLWARFAALAPLLAIVIIPKTSQITDKFYFDHVAKGSEITAKAVGFKPENFKKASPAEQKERWNFIHRSVATDFGLGVPYAVLHSFFYNMFAGLKGKKSEEPKESSDRIAAEPAAQISSSSGGSNFSQRVAQRSGSFTEQEIAREVAASEQAPGAVR